MYYLYTYVTHNDRYFDSLLDSCEKHDITPVVRGIGDKWEGYVKRHEDLLEFLHTLNDDDIVVNVDGFDTIVLDNLEEICNRFKTLKCDMLFSMTADNGGILNKYVQWKLGFLGEKANAGMFMGYVFKLKEVINIILNYKDEKFNDQIIVNKIIYKDPKINIDKNNYIFLNILNLSNVNINDQKITYKKSIPCIMSAPGCVDLVDTFRDLGIKESKYKCNAGQRFKEYYDHFIPEIIIIIIVLIYLYKKLSKMKIQRKK
jgi:hypothetical protein